MNWRGRESGGADQPWRGRAASGRQAPPAQMLGSGESGEKAVGQGARWAQLFSRQGGQGQACREEELAQDPPQPTACSHCGRCKSARVPGHPPCVTTVLILISESPLDEVLFRVCTPLLSGLHDWALLFPSSEKTAMGSDSKAQPYIRLKSPLHHQPPGLLPNS